MEAEELAQILKDMYNNAKDGESTTMIHLFGIRYGKAIELCDATPQNIAKLAGISENYGVEIGKGIRLSRYVTEN
jgi:hypothetical protein